MVNWSQACAAQESRPPWQLQQADYGGCLFAVSALLWLLAQRRRVSVHLLPRAVREFTGFCVLSR